MTTMLVSTLYKGPHYELIGPYKKDIIANHKKFAEYNDMEYRLYGEELTYRFKNIKPYHFTKWDIPVNPLNILPGIGKLYAILSAIEDYPWIKHYMFVDFDSVFINKVKIKDESNYVDEINYENAEATFSRQQSPFLYDMSFFYYYCMYKGITYKDIQNYSPEYRYNSGLFIVNKKFISNDSVNEYVDFCLKLHENKMYHSKSNSNNKDGMLLPYEKSDLLGKDKHAIFHPSDEVWFQYRRTQLLKDKDNNIHFPMLNDTWNVIGGKDNTGIIKKANHIHCINKSGIPYCLENSNV